MMKATDATNGDCGNIGSKCVDCTLEGADLDLPPEEIDAAVYVAKGSPRSSSEVVGCYTKDDSGKSRDSVIVCDDESTSCLVLADDNSGCSNVGDNALSEKDLIWRQPLSSFMCPICLSENEVYHVQNTTVRSQSGPLSPKEPALDALLESGDWEVILAVTSEENGNSATSRGDSSKVNQDVAESQCAEDKSVSQPSTHNVYENQHGIPIFELSSCGHKFCSPCIYAYICSKLMEGTIQIPCCHFLVPDENPEDFHCCDVHIQESDILSLIDTDASSDISRFGTWLSKTNDHCGDFHKASMKVKYQKIKFDSLHGKDSVRRCPKCDDPRLFDVSCMKACERRLRAQNESDSLIISGGISKNNNVDERTVFGRLFAVLGWRRQRLPFTGAESSSHVSFSETRKRTDSGNPGSLAEETMSAYDIVDTNRMKTINVDSLSLSMKPIVTCQTCSTEFCYFHSNAHPGETCEYYNKKTLELDRVNVEYASRTLHSKQCPSCGILVSKEGGCNQIKCGNCGIHFCWLCRTIVDDGAFPEHFRWWNLNGCPNMQLDGSEEPMQCTICMAKLLSILQLIVFGIPSLALALASSLVCPCLLPGLGRTHRERAVNCISFWGSFLSTLIVFPLSCIGMLVMAGVYCFMAMIILFMKCCTALMKRIGHIAATSDNASTVSGINPTDRNSNSHIAPDTSSENFLMELERIFERMEEGA